MQCPECGWNNEADRLFCARCASELVPGAAAQTEPPRARERSVRRLRKARAAAGRWQRHLRSVLRTSAAAVRKGCADALVGAALVSASIVPGLAHTIVGERRLGVCLLSTFAATIAAGMYWLGTQIESIARFAAGCLVFASVLDIARVNPHTRQRQAARASHFLLALALSLSCYAAALEVLDTIWERARIPVAVVLLTESRHGNYRLEDGPQALQEGETVVFRRLAYRSAPPARGDIVRAVVGHDYTVQRILAVPGDRLALDRGCLYLNDQPLPASAYPLQAAQNFAPAIFNAQWSAVLGDDQYAVWGEQSQGSGMIEVGPVIVRRADIHSKAWMAYGPNGRRLINHLDPAR